MCRVVFQEVRVPCRIPGSSCAVSYSRKFVCRVVCRVVMCLVVMCRVVFQDVRVTCCVPGCSFAVSYSNNNNNDLLEKDGGTQIYRIGFFPLSCPFAHN